MVPARPTSEAMPVSALLSLAVSLCTVAVVFWKDVPPAPRQLSCSGSRWLTRVVSMLVSRAAASLACAWKVAI